MGSELTEGYVDVSAFSVNGGVSTYNANSAGTVIGNYYVNWDSSTGFTGNGWCPADTYVKGQSSITIYEEWSPAYGYTDQEIQDEIRNNGNLNTMFANWKHTERLSWVTAMYYASCATPTL